MKNTKKTSKAHSHLKIDSHWINEAAKNIFKDKVIEFDLPKGYSAEDAFNTSIWWSIRQAKSPNSITEYRFIWWKDIVKHFGGSFFSEPITTKDRASFLLLLAAANGHKLE